MDRWFDGVYLAGRYNWLQTGVWLLAHNGEAAVLELPPTSLVGVSAGPNPAADAREAARALGAEVKYLLCTHAHHDHFSTRTLDAMRRAFPRARVTLQSGFRQVVDGPEVTYFDSQLALALGGEPLHLIHAPKHSWTDTVVVFRGSACTGDWELNTIRTVNERVPVETRLASCARLAEFAWRANYHIHRVYSVHANDRREGVDWFALLDETRRDRKLW
ncbi:MAG: hypothetical protein K2V38_29775 [Gemmataceae bacterium]|nr:hypothetical protein [Gemmataceae bacterium]